MSCLSLTPKYIALMQVTAGLLLRKLAIEQYPWAKITNRIICQSQKGLRRQDTALWWTELTVNLPSVVLLVITNSRTRINSQLNSKLWLLSLMCQCECATQQTISCLWHATASGTACQTRRACRSWMNTSIKRNRSHIICVHLSRNFSTRYVPSRRPTE